MVEKETVEIVKRYLRAIPKRYKVKKAFLFGSFAKNQQHRDSDIDVAIVLRSSKLTDKADLDLMIARRGVDMRIEPHPILAKDFNKNSPLVQEVVKYGIPIAIR